MAFPNALIVASDRVARTMESSFNWVIIIKVTCCFAMVDSRLPETSTALDVDERLTNHAVFTTRDVELDPFDRHQPVPTIAAAKSASEIIDNFLSIVEQYRRNHDNCTPGTTFNLGDGVVAQYGLRRFRHQAMAAVDRANFLTRLWKNANSQVLTSSSNSNTSSRPGVVPLDSELFLYLAVLSTVEADDDLFAAVNCYDFGEYKTYRLFCPYIDCAAYRLFCIPIVLPYIDCVVYRLFCPYIDCSLYRLFCPYAYRLPVAQNGINDVPMQKNRTNDAERYRVAVKDLAIEYDYLDQRSEFFYQARLKAQIKLNGSYNTTFATMLFRHNDTSYQASSVDETLLIDYDDGHWSKPYFDCRGGDIWMMTYSVPFFGFRNGRYYFKGTSGIDIDLQKVDIDQCPLVAGTDELNVFAGSDKCKPETTHCVPVPGQGFRRGSYKCVCNRGFYFPNTELSPEARYFSGIVVESEFEKMMMGNPNAYSLKSFVCLPCAVGCDLCVDSRPCVLTLNWTVRLLILSISGLVIVFWVPAIVWFTYRYRQYRIVKAASPVLLRIVIFGALLLYSPMLVQYSGATAIQCSVSMWLRGLGFSILYGALLLKTWRISIVFRIRSARRVRISDLDLIKRLAIIVLLFTSFMTIRSTLDHQPRAETGYNTEGLRVRQCTINFWDYGMVIAELCLLLWGVRLCIIVRKAPSEFNESKFISWAIYNETLLSFFLNVTMFFLHSPSNPDLLYIVQFFHTQLTTTVTLAFLVGSKVYLVYKYGSGSVALTLRRGHRSAGGHQHCKNRPSTDDGKFLTMALTSTPSASQIRVKIADESIMSNADVGTVPSMQIALPMASESATPCQSPEITGDGRFLQCQLGARLSQPESGGEISQQLAGVSISDKDVRDEFRRLYTQLAMVRLDEMRCNNPHLSPPNAASGATMSGDQPESIAQNTNDNGNAVCRTRTSPTCFSVTLNGKARCLVTEEGSGGHRSHGRRLAATIISRYTELKRNFGTPMMHTNE